MIDVCLPGKLFMIRSRIYIRARRIMYVRILSEEVEERMYITYERLHGKSATTSLFCCPRRLLVEIIPT